MFLQQGLKLIASEFFFVFFQKVLVFLQKGLKLIASEFLMVFLQKVLVFLQKVWCSYKRG